VHTPQRPRDRSLPFRHIFLGLLCLGVVALYGWIAQAGAARDQVEKPENAYYNLLVQGFRHGQLNLKVEVPPGLLQLPDPYDPVANEAFRATLHDTSLFQGKIYLYFGVVPALVLFWPYAVATGGYLSHATAAAFFCSAGFLASTGLFFAVRRRYFPAASPTITSLSALALGLATAVPVLLGRAGVWEVPIACAYAFAMLSLGAIWRALHESERRGRWLTAASFAYGLAVGARPSLLFGAIILVVPVACAWRKAGAGGTGRWRERLLLLAAAVAPITFIGTGLLLYNHARFGSATEFGQKFQLAGVAVAQQKLFSADYLWFNLRTYFFQPLRWSAEFPFAQGSKTPPLPHGHIGVDGAFGSLAAMPFLWLAAGALAAWHARGAQGDRSPLRWFIGAVGLLFVCSAVMLCLFAGAADRYQVDFLPALALLATIGLLEWERISGSRFTVHLLAGLLVLVSAGTGWLASYKSSPQAQTVAGNNFFQAGQIAPAMREYERALRTEPDFAFAHHGLAITFMAAGRLPEAVDHFREAVRSKPGFAEAYNGLGVALLRQHQVPAALQAFESALHADPHFAEAHFDCAVALLQLHRAGEAVSHLEEALRLKPGFSTARSLLESLRPPVTSY